jgi:ribonuclease BN (tRNA processing enzyme)
MGSNGNIRLLMKIKLAFLGTGNCVSTGRNPSSFAISNGDKIALIDCGGGCYHQISRLGDESFNHENISDVLLTHFHPDHTTGLIDLIWGEMWDPISPRRSPLAIFGPAGLAHFIKECVLPIIGNHEIPFELIFHELAPNEIFPGPFFSARSFKLSHTFSSCGYLIETDTRKLGITGDTGFCDNLLKLLSSSDSAIVEWSLSANADAPYHLSDADIVRLIQADAMPREVYFTHLYPLSGISMEQLIERKRKLLGAKAHQCFFPHDREVVELQ